MNDQDVRDMLRERAASITPSPDGLERIQAKLDGAVASAASGRRRFPVLASAAAVAVVAVIGAVVVAQRDDTTTVEGGPLADSPTTSEVPLPAGLPLGVFPWEAFGEPADDPAFADPVQTARAYVASRVTAVGETTDGGFVQGDATSGEVTFAGRVSTTVFVRQHGDRWYVTGAASDLVTLHDAGDGTLTAHVEIGGLLTHVREHSTGFGEDGTPVEVRGGEEYTGLGYDLGRNDVVLRERWVLDLADGTAALTETSFAPPTAVLPDTPATAAVGQGVWPWPDDEHEDTWLADPRETALRYVAFRLGGELGDTVVSEFQQGDSSSGEVVFTGDVSTTVVLRQLDGIWHVEAAVTELLDLLVEADEVAWTARRGGELTGNAEGAHMPGDERGPVRYEAGSGGSIELTEATGVVRHRFRFVADDGTIGLAEVRVDHGDAASESGIPEDAIFEEGGLDATAVAQAYLTDRLRGPTVTAGELRITEDGDAEVPWDAGVVILRQQDDGHWYVIEATGESVQIEGYSRDVDYIGGTVVVAEPGTLRFAAGATTWEIPVDEAGEGTRIPFEHSIEDDTSPSLRVVLVTANGLVSLAEQPLTVGRF